MPQTNYKLDVEAFLTLFGGARAIERAAEMAGMDMVKYKGMRQWVRRGTMPLARFLELVILAKMANLDFDLGDYIVKTKEAT